MEDMASLWSYQESNDELKLKIHYTALELEAVRAKANEEMNKNTEAVKQLLHLLKLVCHERDEARDQIQKLHNKIIMPSMNKSIISDCFVIDHVHQHQYPLIKQSNGLSNPYNRGFLDPITSQEFIDINKNTSFVQDYNMLPNGFHTIHSPQIMNCDNATLMMENMIKGKVLPQKGNLLKAVIEAGPLLQTLFETNTLPRWAKLSPPQLFCSGDQKKQSQQLFEMSSGSFSQVIDGGILSFDYLNSGNCQGRVAGSYPAASNFGPIEKKQRFR